MTDTLFDPDIYGPGSKRKPATRRVAGLAIEAHVEPWTLIRQRDGVAPFFHLPLGRSHLSATIVACGLQGTEITNAGVDQMIRCPLCQVASELHR